MSVELYPHNQETFNKIIDHWKTNRKAAVVQATGTGKSFLILKCLDYYKHQHKIMLAPSNYIFNQIITHNNEIKPDNTEFITYAKLSIMEEKEISDLQAELIVFDEFHRCGAEEWGKGVQQLINTFSDAKLLGTSATPIRFLDDERNMEDELFDGNVVVNLSLAKAIVSNILPMPHYISALYTFNDVIINLESKINSSFNNIYDKENLLNEVKVLKNMLEKSKGVPVILAKHLNNKYGKFIVFCKDKQHLFDMKLIVKNWFSKAMKNTPIHSYVSYSEYYNSATEFNEFSNSNISDGIHLLFCIDMLNEGVHVSDVDGVILLRPTISPNIYYQQIGRAIDAGNSKEPFIFDLVDNFNSIGAINLKEALQHEFEAIKPNQSPIIHGTNNIISNFIIYDEILEVRELFSKIENKLYDSWKYNYEKLKSYYDEYGDSDILTNHYDKTLYNWTSNQRQNLKNNALSIEKINLLNKLNFTWDYVDKHWDTMFNQLKDFYLENGTCNISDSQNKLTGWILRQRKYKRNNILSEEKIKKLNSINFIWDIQEQRYNDGIKHYIEFVNQHHLNFIPKGYICEDGFTLHNWEINLIKKYKDGTLSQEKINQLIALGYKFKNRRDITFDNNLRKLIKYIKENSCNSDIGQNTVYEGVNIGGWVSHIRKQYKDLTLSEPKIKELESIGFIFDSLEHQWDEMYNKLNEYQQQYNTINVDKKDLNNKKLYGWILEQRKRYKNGKMPQERIDLLKKIGFNFYNRRQVE